jgi:hypothetical protein
MEAIDALEVRLASNVMAWPARGRWHVNAGSSTAVGIGRELREAINDLLVKLGLTP